MNTQPYIYDEKTQTLTISRATTTNEAIDISSMAEKNLKKIIIEEEARVILSTHVLTSCTIEIGASAELEFLALENSSSTTNTPVIQNVVLSDNARARFFTGIFSSLDLRITATLSGNKTVFENHALYFGSAADSIALTYLSEHHGKETMSRTIVHGVAAEKSHISFTGSINIHQTGSGTDGFLGHEGILLGEKARIDALPGLEIGTDDVKATHTSAIHYISPEQLFYLQSRGMNETEGKQLIITGFLESILSTVTDDALKSSIHALIEERQKMIT